MIVAIHCTFVLRAKVYTALLPERRRKSWRAFLKRARYNPSITKRGMMKHVLATMPTFNHPYSSDG